VLFRSPRSPRPGFWPSTAPRRLRRSGAVRASRSVPSPAVSLRGAPGAPVSFCRTRAGPAGQPKDRRPLFPSAWEVWGRWGKVSPPDISPCFLLKPTCACRVKALELRIAEWYHFSRLKSLCQKSLPASLFQREESLLTTGGRFLPVFPPLEKRDFTAFQKARKSEIHRAAPEITQGLRRRYFNGKKMYPLLRSSGKRREGIE
jgi:hypothetical protein